MATFIDKVHLRLQAGDGGKGCVSVRREKYKPLAGPDGGNGGNGGSIVFVASEKITSLLDFKYKSELKAKNGEIGRGSKKDGANASDLVMDVPVGTVIKENGISLADLDFPGKSFIAAAGGVGGLGNAALANKKIISPKFALLGVQGDKKDITLELKTLADVGLVGFPSSGKSSIISAISAAKPKIADYPFTTLTPNLAVVSANDITFTVADVPGLIPGASSGKGMGFEFLRHIERVSIIAHIVDLAPMELDRSPYGDTKAIEKELSIYEKDFITDNPEYSLSKKKRIIVLNKADTVDEQVIKKVQNDVAAFGWEVFTISAATHSGLKELNSFLADLIQKQREKVFAEQKQKNATAKVLKIAPKKDAAKVEKIKTKASFYYRITGRLPELWAKQIDWSNLDAVAFFSSSLEKLGVEKQLTDLGVRVGDQIRVGTGDTPYIFEYEEE
ncbi:MAG: GTPase ObgE [Bifidobacteriaceae bacterium]|jgi:GTP-binding protein|nr:GTPase ObgE [Bifidobacteriaceae bacterium]